MIPFMGCVIVPTPDGVRLTGVSRDHMMAVAVTCKTFRPPFTVKTVAKTDSTNLRLYWHVGEVIFNWECSVRRLKVHDPATGQWWDADEEGFIEVNQWHEIAWEIAPDSMRVLVDGKLRFERDGTGEASRRRWRSARASGAQLRSGLSRLSSAIRFRPRLGSVNTTRLIAI